MILKQNKGRVVGILDSTEQFRKLTADPRATTERKRQRGFRKNKSKFLE